MPTLEDIAALAGVSRATVSRVINNQPRVSAETRDRVWQVIREQGYQPNVAARALAARRSEIIGLVIPRALHRTFSDTYFSGLIQGVASACDQRGYSLMFSPVVARAPDAYDRILRGGYVDGLVVASALDESIVDRLHDDGFPFVLVGRHRSRTDINSVMADYVRGAMMATHHLVRLGYERIATITGPQDYGISIDRRDGFLAALEGAGLTCPASYVVEGDFTEWTGYQGMQRLLGLPQRPEAVFCACDSMALGALKAIRAGGLRVPDDVALVGFDDITLATAVEPALTTVRQPIEQTGFAAASLLIDVLQATAQDPERQVPPQRIVLPVELVVRDSCGQNHRYQNRPPA